MHKSKEVQQQQLGHKSKEQQWQLGRKVFRGIFFLCASLGKGTLYWYCAATATIVLLVRVYLLVIVWTCQNHSI
jgi:hypothetical protein